MNSFIVLVESVPHKTSPVVTWRIVFVLHQHLVEVFKSHWEPISADLLAYSTKMVHGLNVLWLQLNRSHVVRFGLFHLACFVPAESSVIKGLEVAAVQVDRFRVVTDSCFKVALLAISESTVVEEVCFSRLKQDGLCKAFNGLVVVSSSVQGDSFVVICEGVLWLNLDCG